MKISPDHLIELLRHKEIQSEKVLAAIRKVPRHLFVNPEYLEIAYEDHPLSIGYQQVITQPYLVARMTEEVMKSKNIKKVLEIGTGSGYQAAVLAQLVSEVYSIERIKPLYEAAKSRLKKLADGGRMVIPLGDSNHQILYTIIRHGNSYERHALDAVLFVPLLPGKTEK